METAVLCKMINEIDWSQYETAYGNAAQDIPHFQVGKTPSVPSSLWALFSGDRERAMQAASSLWAVPPAPGEARRRIGRSSCGRS